MTIMNSLETIDHGLYLESEISEWHEKCQILSREELIRVLKDLKEGRESELAKLILLPFPRFVELYFLPYSEVNNYFQDPSFPYKMYFLSDAALRSFAERARKIIPKYTPKSRKTPHSYNDELYFLQTTSLEDIPKTVTYTKAKLYTIKYIQMTRYIDVDEAERLNMRIAQSFWLDHSVGFDLEGKLNLLNPTVKKIMIKYLGLCGEPIHSLDDLAVLVGITNHKRSDLISELLDILLPKFSKSYEEFKSSIGYDETMQTPGNYREYKNPKFAHLDIVLETRRLFRQLPEADQAILSNLTKPERECYLAAKYMFKTPKSLARNMTLALDEATKRLAYIAKEQK